MAANTFELDPIRVHSSIMSDHKRAGVDFDTAWERAFALATECAAEAGIIEGETTTRALNATRHVWEASYGGGALATGLGLEVVVPDVAAVVSD